MGISPVYTELWTEEFSKPAIQLPPLTMTVALRPSHHYRLITEIAALFNGRIHQAKRKTCGVQATAGIGSEMDCRMCDTVGGE